MNRLFEYEMTLGKNGIDANYKYNNYVDAIFLINSDAKLHDFFRCVVYELRGYKMLFQNGVFDVMPVAYFKSPQGIEYVSLDYAFLIQTIARYMCKFVDRSNAELFVKDFEYTKDNDRFFINSIPLFHNYLQEYLGLVYTNSPKRNLKIEYLHSFTNTVYQFEKKAIEFGAVNFRMDKFLERFGDEKMIKNLVDLAKLGDAKQLAYGKPKSDEFWKKSKQSLTYFLSFDSILF